jgi:hypothetical protein
MLIVMMMSKSMSVVVMWVRIKTKVFPKGERKVLGKYRDMFYHWIWHRDMFDNMNRDMLVDWVRDVFDNVLHHRIRNMLHHWNRYLLDHGHRNGYSLISRRGHFISYFSCICNGKIIYDQVR